MSENTMSLVIEIIHFMNNLDYTAGASSFHTLFASFVIWLSMIGFKRVPKDILQKIDLLTEFYNRDPDIIFAYLFGGMLRERINPFSDVDLAVYVKDPERLDYLQLYGRTADILGSDEIDLVILNNAPISLTGRILQKRKVLVDKDPFFRHKYESVMLREFFDFSAKERVILKRRYGIG